MKNEDDPVRRDVARNIRTYRLALGWSQEKLAEQSSLATSMIGSIETHAKFPSTRSLLRLSQALDVEVHELFEPPRGEHRNSLNKLYDIAALRESLKNEVIEIVNQKFTEYQKGQDSRDSAALPEDQEDGTETEDTQS